MKSKIMNAIRDYVANEGMIMGVARADVLNEKAPEGFRPKDMMAGAQSVLIFAKPLPLAVFLTPEGFNHLFYQRSAYLYYLLMDKVADTVSMMLQDAGYLALPIPSYSPLRFHEGEPRGAISLKHAAEEAKLGRLGRNTLLIHQLKGNVMRLGGLMTAMEWPPDNTGAIKDPCPDGCRRCEQACPVEALKNGTIDKTACLGQCIKHTLLPPSMMLPLVKRIVGSSRMLTRFMELFSLNFFELYGIGCIACLKSCPYFPAMRGERDHENKTWNQHSFNRR